MVNDGRDAKTRDLIIQLQADFSVRYLELDHPPVGFGLCHARNLGLDAARGEIVAYLDDDNAIASEFVAKSKQLFQTHPEAKFSMAKQSRRRDVVKDKQVVKNWTLDKKIRFA